MSTGSKPAEDKTAAIASAIAELVADLLRPLLIDPTELRERLTALELNVSGLHARIEAASDMHPPAKRAVRQELVPGAAGAAGAAPGVAAAGVKTPANAMLWLKQQYGANPAVRAKYAANLGAQTSKHLAGSAEAFAAEATLIWKGLTAPDKAIIKADFDAWKTEKLRTDVPAPLTLDGAEAEADSETED